MIEVKDIKNSLRIDHSMDDDLFDRLIMMASDYIIHAIDSNAKADIIENYKQFDWAVSLLTQHWYLNRQEASSERIPVTVQSMIQQMRGKYYANN